MNNPKVFIGYSHDSPEHADRVLAFTNRLRSNGIDCDLDQFDPAPSQAWPRWMEEKILSADFVLIICTETYYRRATGKEVPDQGRGVSWEAHLIYNLLYHDKLKTQKFIPVLFDKHDQKYIPTPISTHTNYQPLTMEGYETLYRRLTNQPEVKKTRTRRTS